MLRIGKLHLKSQVLLAPLEGVNCKGFRQVCAEYGAGLTSTPMILANKLLEDKARQLGIINFSRNEHPLMVQLAGNESELMKQATLMVDEYADVIDVNLGCCEHDVLGLKAGAFFTKHPEQLKKVIPPVMSNTNKPVTAKIRIGWDEKSVKTVEICKALEDFGVSAITVHARTRSQSYSVKANWNEIKRAKASVNIPIIGNGDVSLPGNAKAMLERTGCDAVMIGRAAKGNPIIFKRTAYLLETGKNLPEPTDLDQVNCFIRFADFYNQQEKKSLSEFKQQALWFASFIRKNNRLKDSIRSASGFDQVTRAFQGEIRF
ncbi:tRNA-dihydrouridine synthase [Candidatus Woesearchaeota archaeon]|nr:tRNA-dihydrouridine synthase [Candidatus Woesearchaeota archaeon]